MRTKKEFPSCPYCGTEFAWRVGHYGFGEKVQLQSEWAHAHDFGVKKTRTIDCPECGKRIRIGYQCVMYAVAEKVVE